MQLFMVTFSEAEIYLDCSSITQKKETLGIKISSLSQGTGCTV